VNQFSFSRLSRIGMACIINPGESGTHGLIVLYRPAVRLGDQAPFDHHRYDFKRRHFRRLLRKITEHRVTIESWFFDDSFTMDLCCRRKSRQIVLICDNGRDVSPKLLYIARVRDKRRD